MLTAKQIAKELGLDVHVVRYRLDRLREKSKIKYKQYGTTYIYPENTVEKVGGYYDLP